VAEGIDRRGHTNVRGHEGQGHHHRLPQPHPDGWQRAGVQAQAVPHRGKAIIVCGARPDLQG
jgi:hypothetical protein